MTPAELLRLYDREVRGSFARRLPPGWTAEQDGPLTRCLTTRGGFAMLTADAASLPAAELADLVARTVAFYSGLGRRFEWKTFDHDHGGLAGLLRDHGALPEPHEALVLGESAALADDPVLPAELRMRSVAADDACGAAGVDLRRIAAMESEVWGEDWSWLAEDLAGRLTADPPAEVLLVEDGDTIVSAAWLVPLAGTPVAGLWGGSTLASHRGRGIYRALVARRAQLAVERGHPILQVDASDDSRPILERLGLHVVGGTTPYVVTPPRAG